MEENTPVIETSKVKIILFLLSLVILLQALVVNGNLPVSLSTIEKAFNFNSNEIGSVFIIYNITLALTCLFIGYIVKTHKKQIIGTSPILTAMGCFIFIIPVFIKIKQEIYASTKSDLCSEIPINATHVQCSASPYSYLFIMYLGYFFIGIGAAIICSIGLDYIDEICLPSNSGIYHAIFYATGCLGPTLSYFGSKLIFKIYIYPTAKKLQINSESETWIGAYWILYVISFILSFILGVVLLIVSEPPNIRKQSKSAKVENLNFNLILKQTKLLIYNIPYITVVTGNIFDGIIYNSFANFASKYLQFQFNMSAGSAAIYIGIIIVGGGSCAILVGGIILKIYELSLERLCAFNMIFNILSLIFMTCLFIHCPNMNILGVTGYDTNELKFNFPITNTCNCNIMNFVPICNGEDNYYSPCSIGCKYKMGQSGKYLYYNCSHLNESNSVATQGFCPTKCKHFWGFIVLFFLAVWCQLLLAAPEIRYIIKTVKEEHILFALGFGQFIFRLGLMIGPLIFGSIFDYTCDIFQPPLGCKSSSNCIKYNLPQLSFTIGITCVTFKLISLSLQIYAYYYIRKNKIT